MSDPVTNAEVEDVLSSIRRLVSEDKRPIQAPQAAPKNDRLVLTPSLRVSDDSTEKVAEGQDDPDALTEGRGPETSLLDLVSEERVEPKISIDSLVTDDTPVDVFADRTISVDEDEEPDVAEADLEDEDVEDDFLFDDPSGDYSTDPYGFDDDLDEDGQSDDSYLKRYVAEESPQEAEPADTPVEEEPAWPASEMAKLSEQEMAKLSEQTPEVSEEAASVDDVEIDKPDNSSTQTSVKAAALTAKIAALETAIGQIAETWEPDDAGDSDYAGSDGEAMAWEDDLPEHETLEPSRQEIQSKFSETADELAATEQKTETYDPEPAKTQSIESAHSEQTMDSQPAAGAMPEDKVIAVDDVDSSESSSGLELDSDEQLIDEEALRDLVADIVRSELQGALGERITRNVRKLVRREIHRALTAQELD